MTSYAKSAYKNPFPNGVPQPSRSAQGWGSGWPNCQASKMKTITAQDQTTGENYDIKVTVRAEIAQLVADLLEATDKLYDLDQHDTGAYNCRPIAGTSRASNHSWGLAIDLNWDDNPQGAWTHSVIPPKVVAMWIDCGFGWGGFYKGTPDLMHFEYLGTPKSVAANAKKAAKYNGTAPAPAPAPKPKPVPVDPIYTKALGDKVAPGGHDPQVADLQRLLVLAGFGPIEGTPPYTSFYGGNTEEAVARYLAKYPAYASKAHDVAIGVKGYANLQKLALKAKKG